MAVSKILLGSNSVPLNVGVSPVLSWRHPRRHIGAVAVKLASCRMLDSRSARRGFITCCWQEMDGCVCAQAGLLLMCRSVDDGPVNIYIELQEFKHGPGSGFECAVGTNFH